MFTVFRKIPLAAPWRTRKEGTRLQAHVKVLQTKGRNAGSKREALVRGDNPSGAQKGRERSGPKLRDRVRGRNWKVVKWTAERMKWPESTEDGKGIYRTPRMPEAGEERQATEPSALSPEGQGGPGKLSSH